MSSLYMNDSIWFTLLLRPSGPTGQRSISMCSSRLQWLLQPRFPASLFLTSLVAFCQAVYRGDYQKRQCEHMGRWRATLYLHFGVQGFSLGSTRRENNTLLGKHLPSYRVQTRRETMSYLLRRRLGIRLDCDKTATASILGEESGLLPRKATKS